MIKYKGQTSTILKDLSLAMNLPVQLRTSEESLSLFFNYVMHNISQEKAILLLSHLPAPLKRFCRKQPGLHFSPECDTKTVNAILHTLDRHIPAPQLIQVYSCFPESVFPNASAYKSLSKLTLKSY